MYTSSISLMVSYYKNMLVKYWPSLLVLGLVAAGSRYLNVACTAGLAFAAWRIHCKIFNLLSSEAS